MIAGFRHRGASASRKDGPGALATAATARPRRRRSCGSRTGSTACPYAAATTRRQSAAAMVIERSSTAAGARARRIQNAHRQGSVSGRGRRAAKRTRSIAPRPRAWRRPAWASRAAPEASGMRARSFPGPRLELRSRRGSRRQNHGAASPTRGRRRRRRRMPPPQAGKHRAAPGPPRAARRHARQNHGPVCAVEAVRHGVYVSVPGSARVQPVAISRCERPHIDERCRPTGHLRQGPAPFVDRLLWMRFGERQSTAAR